MRLAARIDHQRARAAPVFLLDERPNPIDIGGGIATRKGDPEKVLKALGSELAVVAEDDQRELIDGRGNVKALTE